jgi:hypothetical protein
MDKITAGTRIGAYEVLAPIGAGGMGEVYRAHDTSLNRTVAVKVISGKMAHDGGARERFLREARAMAAVEHPHLVRIYSFGESAGVVYLVMEYVEGENLGDRLRRLTKFQLDETLQIARQIVDGLEAAWERGMVHRDIKPSNILIDAKDHVRVADFGLAKAAEAAADETLLTHTSAIVGTPHYLSPEQARGDKVDFRSDIYSLGIVLYEMLTGAPPFTGASPVAVVAHQLHSPLPPLREKRPELPLGLVQVVEQMTEKDASRRPQSYAALRKALGESVEPPARWMSGSPYRGLAAFDFDHAPIFFGRTRAIDGVVTALRAQAANGRTFVLVLGMSGSGKSSLVRAGVLPRLVQQVAIEGVRLWRRAILRPGDATGDIFDALASALMQREALPELGSDGTTTGELGRLLRQNPKGAALLVKGGLSQAATELRRTEGAGEQPEARLVVVVDQMEELFTLEKISSEERKSFVDALSALAGSGRVWVIGTLRSDFYARCEELPELMTLKEGQGQYHLLPPTASEIGQMIRLPAWAAGLRFEVDASTQIALDEVLRDSASGHAGNLPLLEFALEELYRQRTAGGLLTYSAYHGVGGIDGALSQRAEAVFASIAPGVQSAFPHVFGALLRVGPLEEETFNRKYAPLDSLTHAEDRAFVDAFVASRLFTADRGDDGRPIVSIAHEMLLQSWPRLRSWIEENRDLLRVRGRVAAAAELWTEKGKLPDLLLAEGKPLEDALPLLQTRGIDVLPKERAFIEASEARARARRRTRLLMNLNSILLLIGTAVIFSIYLWKVVPLFTQVSQRHNLVVILPVRISIALSHFTAGFAPFFAVLAAGLYLAGKRIRLPEFITSGLALLIVTGILVLLSLMGLLVGLLNAASVIRVFLSFRNS